MKILFLHQNFPAQFVHVAQAIHASPSVAARALTDADNGQRSPVPVFRYRSPPRSAAPRLPLVSSFAARVARGEMAALAMVAMREEGYVPDVVVGHIGWGETLFVRDVWPTAKLVVHAEYFYSATGGDVGFDPEFDGPRSPTSDFALRTKNAALLMAVADADYGVAPTQWQGSRFPPLLRRKIAILHEGIDTDAASPAPEARFTVPGTGLVLGRGDEVITFVNRNLEPYRGFHVFMRALPEILAARPRARAVIVGGDEVSYGRAPADGRSWRETLLDEVGIRLPLDRVHFVGKIAYPVLLDLLRVSAAHVYLTYPFVLSWSMLDAMSVGALVVGSRTAPVEEVLRHGENGLLIDFFDVPGLARTVVEVLADPARFAPLRTAARATVVAGYDLKRVCLPKWLAFLSGIVGAPLP